VDLPKQDETADYRGDKPQPEPIEENYGQPSSGNVEPASNERAGLEPTLDHPSGTKKGRESVTTVTYEAFQLIGHRYRILRPHARGGLGQVSIAEDMELSREVAFKELREQYADDPDRRARFAFEAEITGALEHPGVVPVYGMGQHADGRPFYSMRFIRGETLKHAIEKYHSTTRRQGGRQDSRMASERSVDFRKLLRRYLDVCNVMHYSHSRHVLHRDLKPSNIMLGEYGETLVVDWGLAKRLGTAEKISNQSSRLPPSVASDGAATQIGSALGTPQYMSPEQSEGRIDELGPATDTYSLGATLYYLLTGSPPFAGDDTFMLFENVRTGSFARPREISPKVPAALESVCLKAMALRPADRYATAAALAEDIEHWLADEPVLAHREGPIERAGRWVRRHRSWVLAGTAAAMLVTTVSVIAAIMINRAREKATNLAQANAELARSEHAARENAIARLREARGAVDTWLTGASVSLGHFPGLQQVRQRLLAEAEKDYARFAEQASDDPELETERGRASLRLGDVRKERGDRSGALEAYEQAVKLFQELAEKHENQDAAIEWANSDTRIGILQTDWGHHDKADTAFQNAISRLHKLTASMTNQSSPSLAIALAEVNWASLLLITGRRDEAEKSLRDAIDHFRKSSPAEQAGFKCRAGEVSAHDQLGRMLADIGHEDEAEAELQTALHGLNDLFELRPGNPEYMESRASTNFLLASVLNMLGRDEDEMNAYRAAEKDYSVLLQNLPDNEDYLENLALTWTDVGEVLQEEARCAQAKEELNRALPIFDKLVKRSLDVPRYLEERAACRDALAQATLATGSQEEARQQCESAGDDLQKLAEQFPDIPEYRERLAVNRGHLADVEQQAKHFDAARKLCTEAITAIKKLSLKEPTTTQYRGELATLYEKLGRVRLAQNELSAAKEAFQTALDERRKLAVEHSAPEYEIAAAWALANCPIVALRDPTEALRLAKSAQGRASRNARYAAVLALALYRHNDFAGAIVACEQVTQLGNKTTALHDLILVMAQANLGKSEDALGSYHRAMKWINENCPHLKELGFLQSEAERTLPAVSSPH
jgi:serine/threonine-protein kinase